MFISGSDLRASVHRNRNQTSPRTRPLENYIRELKRDGEMDVELRDHVLAVTREAQRQVLGCSVLFEINVVAYMALYARLRERKHDALTTGRLVSEMTRTRRSLGLDRPTGRSALHRQRLPVGGEEE